MGFSLYTLSPCIISHLPCYAARPLSYLSMSQNTHLTQPINERTSNYLGIVRMRRLPTLVLMSGAILLEDAWFSQRGPPNSTNNSAFFLDMLPLYAHGVKSIAMTQLARLFNNEIDLLFFL